MAGIDFSVDQQGIGLLSIDRPHVRNALNWAAMEAFAEAVELAHQVADLRALIVTGAGKTFASGGDLSELKDYPEREHGLRLARIMGDALKRLENLKCPTLAAINGPARGGGAEIAVACDLRVMAEDADIGFVHTRLGIATAWGGGQRLLRTVGFSRALELLTTGGVISPKEALTMGLTNLIAPVGKALAAARELASRIAVNPTEAVQATKRFLLYGLCHSELDALAAERAEFPPLWDTEFRREAVSRFLKRARGGKSNGRFPPQVVNKQNLKA